MCIMQLQLQLQLAKLIKAECSFSCIQTCISLPRVCIDDALLPGLGSRECSACSC
jgi:hypothetical protein